MSKQEGEEGEEVCANGCFSTFDEGNSLTECFKCDEPVCQKCIDSQPNGELCDQCARHFIVCDSCGKLDAHPQVYTCRRHGGRICIGCEGDSKCRFEESKGACEKAIKPRKIIKPFDSDCDDPLSGLTSSSEEEGDSATERMLKVKTIAANLKRAREEE